MAMLALFCASIASATLIYKVSIFTKESAQGIYKGITAPKINVVNCDKEHHEEDLFNIDGIGIKARDLQSAVIGAITAAALIVTAYIFKIIIYGQ